MFYTVTNGKFVGETGILSDIGPLVTIGGKENPTKDPRERRKEKLTEEDRESNFIESLTIVHQTCEDFTSIPQEVANSQ